MVLLETQVVSRPSSRLQHGALPGGGLPGQPWQVPAAQPETVER